MKPSTDWLHSGSKYFTSSIRYKIIIPYALLTLILAVVGAYIVTGLVAGSFEERLKNQLVNAGRVVSHEIVNQESFRLEIERAVANTIGVPEAVVDRDLEKLNGLIYPLSANTREIDSIVVVDTQGRELLRLQRNSPGPNAVVQTYRGSGANFSSWPAVSLVLSDARGMVKDAQLARDPTSGELILYTVGPIRTMEGVVGAALVGTYLTKEVERLHDLALADVTLFNQDGEVVASTLVNDQADATEVFSVFTPDRYEQVIEESGVTLLDEVQGPDEGQNLNEVQARGQNYRLAYAPFLLRGQIYGVYAVALPTNFITDTNAESRNLLSTLFSVGVLVVFIIGIAVSGRIIRPIIRLVQTSQAIASGNLNLRTGLEGEDEIGILATAFDDMTGELQRLLKIQEEEASKLNAILSSIADGVIVLDTTGEILTMNPAAREILQSTEGDYAYAAAQEGSGRPANEREKQDRPVVLLDRLKGLNFHEPHRFEVGSQVLSGLSAPVLTSDRQQLGSVVVLRDITREVESERLKDDFITSISHELRTPLTAIKGYNELLKMTAAAKLDDRQLEFVETIDKNVNDLLNLIQEVLDLSQIDAGTLGIDREPVNLTDLVQEEAEKWSTRMEDKELEFHLHRPDEAIWVEGDNSRLARVVHNLIQNAHDYTLPEGRVDVRIRSKDGQVRVDVQDTGVGIAAEHQKFLFTRFFRAIHQESTFEVSGAGLGLYISKAIIEAHDGQIWVESEPSTGSTFSFALSIISVDQDEEKSEQFITMHQHSE